MKFVLIGLRAVFRQPRSIDLSPVESTAAGFTLLETLTALTILAIALVSLFEAHASGLRTAGIAADYAEARIVGRVESQRGEAPASLRAQIDEWLAEHRTPDTG